MKEEEFKQFFVGPMTECFGPSRLPAVKIRFFWDRLKNYPLTVVRQCADRIILTHETFPGVQAALQACADILRTYNEQNAVVIRTETSCHSCRGAGVVTANNFAYRCHCKLGPMLFPNYPEYGGQKTTQPSERVENGERVFEDGNYITYAPVGEKNIRNIRTILKANVSNV